MANDKSTCPFYLGERCSPKNKRNCFILCEGCDGAGNLNGRSLCDIKKEIKKYSRAGIKEAKRKAAKGIKRTKGVSRDFYADRIGLI